MAVNDYVQWVKRAEVAEAEIERLQRLLEMAREEIAWLREQLPGTSVVGELIDGPGGAGTMGS